MSQQWERILTALSNYSVSDNLSIEAITSLLKNADISYLKDRFSELFDGTFASIGSKLNSNSKDYEKKLRASLLGNLRRTYQKKHKSKVLRDIQKKVEKAYKKPSLIIIKRYKTLSDTYHFVYHRLYEKPSKRKLIRHDELKNAIHMYKNQSQKGLINIYITVWYLGYEYVKHNQYVVLKHREVYKKTYNVSVFNNMTRQEKERIVAKVIKQQEDFLNKSQYDRLVIEDELDVREILIN